MDWITNTDSSWWADIVTMPVRSRKSKRFKQADTGALTRGILLRKIVQTTANTSVNGDWLIKSRHEWAELCRVNYSTIERRLNDLRKLRFISIGHKSEPGRPQVLAVQVRWDVIDKKVSELRAA